MANSPDNTNPYDERNSVSDMIFGMDDNLTRLQANLNVLEQLTKDYKLKGATDNQTSVDWAIGHVADTTDELRERFDKVFHATRYWGQDKPAENGKFAAILAAWNTNRRQQGEGPHEMSDEQARRLNEQESILLDKIVATPAASAGEIAAKVFIAKKLIEESGSRWSDERDVKVLGSVMEDLTRLGAGKGERS